MEEKPSDYAWLFEILLGSLAACGYNFHKIFEGLDEHEMPSNWTLPSLVLYLEQRLRAVNSRQLELYMALPSNSPDYMASIHLEWHEDGYIWPTGYSGEFVEVVQTYKTTLENFKQARKDRELAKQMYAEAGYAAHLESHPSWETLYDMHQKQHEGFPEIRAHACSLVVDVEDLIQHIDPEWQEHDFEELGNVLMELWLESFPSLPSVDDIVKHLKY